VANLRPRNAQAREPGILRSQDGTPELIYPTTPATDHEHGWMWTSAGRQEERPNDPFGADWVARNPRSSNVASECRVCTRPVTAHCFDINGKRPHD
jgi:hypothetical protein